MEFPDAQALIKFFKVAEVAGDGDLSDRVNPSSTTIKVVEHFHLLSAEKKQFRMYKSTSSPGLYVIVGEYLKSLCS